MNCYLSAALLLTTIVFTALFSRYFNSNVFFKSSMMCHLTSIRAKTVSLGLFNRIILLSIPTTKPISLIHSNSFRRYDSAGRCDQAARGSAGRGVTQKIQFKKDGSKHRTRSRSQLIRKPRHLFFRKNSNYTVFARFRYPQAVTGL